MRIKLKYPDVDTFIHKYSANISRGGIFVSTTTFSITGPKGVQEISVLSGQTIATVITAVNQFKDATGVSASLDALPEVVESVGERLEVLLDGGVRRGTDVLKALALGARAVLVGRPIVWGLAVNGEDGVREVLELLRAETELGLTQLGCRSSAEVTCAHVKGK